MPWHPPIPRGALYRSEALALGPALSLLAWAYDHIERDGSACVMLESAAEDIGKSYGTIRDWWRQLRKAQGSIFTLIEDHGRKGYRLHFAKEWVDWHVHRANFGEVAPSAERRNSNGEANGEANANQPKPDAERWDSNAETNVETSVQASAETNGEQNGVTGRWNPNGEQSSPLVSTQIDRWNSNGEQIGNKVLMNDHEHHLSVVVVEAAKTALPASPTEPPPPPPPKSAAVEMLAQAIPNWKLSSAQEAKITQAVTNLERWEISVGTWQTEGYKHNLFKILDNYRKEVERAERDKQATSRASPTSERARQNTGSNPERAQWREATTDGW